MITLCGTLCGYEDWVSIEDFGHEQEDWLRQYLELPNGIPSHDTLSDVLGRIDKEAFSKAFTEWVQAGLPSLAEQHIALDGKRVRGTSQGREVLHMMSAFSSEARLVLAVQPVADKRNEISAIPALLAQLDLPQSNRHHRCNGMPKKRCTSHYEMQSRLCVGPQREPAHALRRSARLPRWAGYTRCFAV